MNSDHAGMTQAFLAWSSIITVYAGSIFGSMTIYRTLFHRLRGFPGPIFAKVTKLWHVAQVLDSKNYLYLSRLHRNYGDFVRTGPSELTIFNAEVLGAIDGPANHCTKAVWYDALQPESLINTTRDKVIHTQRRRIWDHAFTAKALPKYYEKIVHYAQRLERRISNSAEKRLDASALLYEFSFDLMGDFAFARAADKDNDQNEEWHAAISSLHNGMALLGPLSPVPWLLHIGLGMSWVPIVRDWNRMVSFCKGCMEQRRKISSWLIDASQRQDISEDEVSHWLYGDAITMVIAGSDTVAPTLVFLFYHIALFPAQAETLRKDLQTVSSIYDVNELQSLLSLNAFINETLRLFPTTPTGGYRETPAEGINVAGHYIPGNTTIVAPAYNIGRLDSYFERPNDFIPERWHSLPGMVKNKRAFAPFKQGRHGCVGQRLALAELSIVVALLVSKYRIHFPAGENGAQVVDDMKDCFTAKPGQLNLVFEVL
ncbi:hypothetical protein MMC28_006070 [Mycoblastus sanguinarius]|nr:hypothetical protein [Mycoblastus sanguinarius]